MKLHLFKLESFIPKKELKKNYKTFENFHRVYELTDFYCFYIFFLLYIWNDFAEISKNLIRCRSKNNFVGSSK